MAMLWTPCAAAAAWESGASQACETAKGALFFAWTIRGGYDYACMPDAEWNAEERMESHSQYRDWLKAQGLYAEGLEKTEFTVIDSATKEEVYTIENAYAFPQGIALSGLEALMKNYFSSDFCAFLTQTGYPEEGLSVKEAKCINANLFVKGNRLYGLADETESFCPIDLNGAKLLYQTEKQMAFLFPQIVDGTPVTVILSATADGWRVCGGSYFEEMGWCMPTPASSASEMYSAPKAGEHVWLYVSASLCAVAMIGVELLLWRRKRKL